MFKESAVCEHQAAVFIGKEVAVLADYICFVIVRTGVDIVESVIVSKLSLLIDGYLVILCRSLIIRNITPQLCFASESDAGYILNIILEDVIEIRSGNQLDRVSLIVDNKAVFGLLDLSHLISFN